MSLRRRSEGDNLKKIKINQGPAYQVSPDLKENLLQGGLTKRKSGGLFGLPIFVLILLLACLSESFRAWAWYWKISWSVAVLLASYYVSPILENLLARKLKEPLDLVTAIKPRGIRGGWHLILAAWSWLLIWALMLCLAWFYGSFWTWAWYWKISWAAAALWLSMYMSNVVEGLVLVRELKRWSDWLNEDSER